MLRLYKWFDVWVAASNERNARKILLEQYTRAEVGRGGISPLRGMVDLAYDYGEVVVSVDAEDVTGVLPPGIVPQID